MQTWYTMMTTQSKKEIAQSQSEYKFTEHKDDHMFDWNMVIQQREVAWSLIPHIQSAKVQAYYLETLVQQAQDQQEIWYWRQIRIQKH